MRNCQKTAEFRSDVSKLRIGPILIHLGSGATAGTLMTRLSLQLPQTGGCQCGAVRYTLSGLPIVFYHCHCTQCQKQSASAFGQSMRVRSADLSITGNTARRIRELANGNHVVGEFCPECGTRLFHRRASYADLLNIKAGTLDDTSWLIPAGHIWTRSKQPSTIIPDDALCYSQQPPDYDELIEKWKMMLGN